MSRLGADRLGQSQGGSGPRPGAVTPTADSTARALAVSTPTDGQLSTLTTSDRVDVYNGSGWSTLVAPSNGALTGMALTITQLGAVTATVNYASYIRVGRMVMGSFKLTVTGSGTALNTITIGGIPFTSSGSLEVLGVGYFADVSAPSFIPVTIAFASTSSFKMYAGGAVSVANAVVGSGTVSSVGLAVGDIISGTFMYEAAADA